MPLDRYSTGRKTPHLGLAIPSGDPSTALIPRYLHNDLWMKRDHVFVGSGHAPKTCRNFNYAWKDFNGNCATIVFYSRRMNFGTLSILIVGKSF